MLCSNKQMVLAINWKRFFEKDSIVVFLWKWSCYFSDLPIAAQNRWITHSIFDA